MMTKNKSKQIKKAKYLLLLPLLASMLLYTSCETNLDDEVLNNQVEDAKTLDELPSSMLKEVIVGNKNQVMEVSMDDKLSSTVRLSIAKNFNADISKELNLRNDKFRIYTFFSVNTKGEIENVKIRAPHPALKKETERVLAMLPKLVPAKKDGKYIAMKYTLPISYNVGNVKNNPKAVNSDNGDYIPFAIIEEVPVFPGCTGTRKEKTDCLNKGIQMFVVRHFNGGLAGNLGLPKGRKRIWVTFRIDKNGDIINVKARAPHPKLQEEAERVAALLPKMKAGRQKGEAVDMKYTLPISFNVE